MHTRAAIPAPPRDELVQMNFILAVVAFINKLRTSEP